jgi:hypothetical protein
MTTGTTLFVIAQVLGVNSEFLVRVIRMVWHSLQVREQLKPPGSLYGPSKLDMGRRLQ